MPSPDAPVLFHISLETPYYIDFRHTDGGYYQLAMRKVFGEEGYVLLLHFHKPGVESKAAGKLGEPLAGEWWNSTMRVLSTYQVHAGPGPATLIDFMSRVTKRHVAGYIPLRFRLPPSSLTSTYTKDLAALGVINISTISIPIDCDPRDYA